MTSQERIIRLQDLVEAIVFIRDHPDVPMPNNWIPDIVNCYMPPGATKEEYVALARKNGFKYKGNDYYSFSLTQKVGNLKLALVIPKEKTCTKVVTGTRFVPAYTVSATTEEEYEWRCDSLLEKIIEENPE